MGQNRQRPAGRLSGARSLARFCTFACTIAHGGKRQRRDVGVCEVAGAPQVVKCAPFPLPRFGPHPTRTRHSREQIRRCANAPVLLPGVRDSRRVGGSMGIANAVSFPRLGGSFGITKHGKKTCRSPVVRGPCFLGCVAHAMLAVTLSNSPHGVLLFARQLHT